MSARGKSRRRNGAAARESGRSRKRTSDRTSDSPRFSGSAAPVLAFVWVLLAVGASVYAARAVQGNIGDDVAQELASAGLDGAVGVEMDGQTARINAADPADVDRAVVLLEKVTGVSTVAFDPGISLPDPGGELDIDADDLPDRSDLAAVLAGESGAEENTVPSPATTVAEAVDSDTDASADDALEPYADVNAEDEVDPRADLDSATTTTVRPSSDDDEDDDEDTTTTLVDQQRTVSATIGDGQVELAGRLRSTRDQATLLDTIESGTPEPRVRNGIRLMRAVETGESRSLLAFAILTNRLATSFSVASAQLIGDDITLSGKVRSNDAMDDIGSIIRTARDTGVAISSSLSVADGGPVTVDSRPILQQDLDRITSRTPIVFVGSTTELTPSGRSAVQAVASAITRNPGWDVEVRAHTDTRGIEAENYTLSRSRAETIHVLLVEAGIDEDTLSFSGFGSTVPGQIGTDGRRVDDRVEFTIEEHIEPVNIDGEDDDEDDETE